MAIGKTLSEGKGHTHTRRSVCLPLRALALVVMLSAPSAFAQTTRFELSAQAGASLGWLRGNRVIDTYDALLAVAGGLGLQYDWSERFGVRLGAGYQRKGSQVKATFTDINGSIVRGGTMRTELDYIMLPMQLRTSFGDRTRVSVGVGPYAGYLLAASNTFAGSGRQLQWDILMTGLERWDLGLSASLGLSRLLGERLALNAELRYDKGLTNISALPVIDNGSIRTNAVCLLAGLSYRFGKAATP